MKKFLKENGVIIFIAMVALLMLIWETSLGNYIGKAITAQIINFVTKSCITNVPTITMPW